VPIVAAAVAYNPSGSINKKPIILKMTIYDAYESTPRYPLIKTIISKAHHSRHKIKQQGIPISKYSLNPLKLCLFGKKIAS
jgi:hypothetical protein